MSGSVTFETLGIARGRVRLPWILSNVFKVTYVVAGLGVLVSSFAANIAMVFASLGGLAGWGLLIASYVLSLLHTWQEGMVEVAADALILRVPNRPSEVVPRSTVVGANVVQRPSPNGNLPTVEVELSDGDRLTLRLADLAAAHALVSTLGFGAGQRRSRARLAMPVGRLFHLPLAIGIHLLVAIPFAFAFGVLAGGWGIGQFLSSALEMGIYLAVARRLRPAEVEIGDDGVHIHRGFSSRFVAAQDPALSGALAGVGVDDVRAREIVNRAAERTAKARTDAQVFERGERSIGEWRRHIKASMEGGYRASPVTAEEAASVLRSAEATAAQRIGAGIALRAFGEQHRVRAAIDATANVRVRVALEAIADDRADEEVERALRRLA
jgi:hypothetical protein